jgi:hypothetical protein
MISERACSVMAQSTFQTRRRAQRTRAHHVQHDSAQSLVPLRQYDVPTTCMCRRCVDTHAADVPLAPAGYVAAIRATVCVCMCTCALTMAACASRTRSAHVRQSSTSPYGSSQSSLSTTGTQPARNASTNRNEPSRRPRGTAQKTDVRNRCA